MGSHTPGTRGLSSICLGIRVRHPGVATTTHVLSPVPVPSCVSPILTPSGTSKLLGQQALCWPHRPHMGPCSPSVPIEGSELLHVCTAPWAATGTLGFPGGRGSGQIPRHPVQGECGGVPGSHPHSTLGQVTPAIHWHCRGHFVVAPLAVCPCQGLCLLLLSCSEGPSLHLCPGCCLRKPPWKWRCSPGPLATTAGPVPPPGSGVSSTRDSPGVLGVQVVAWPHGLQNARWAMQCPRQGASCLVLLPQSTWRASGGQKG